MNNGDLSGVSTVVITPNTPAIDTIDIVVTPAPAATPAAVAPAKTAEDAPAKSAEDAPVEDAPAKTAEDAPAKTAEDAPAKTAEDAPAKTAEDAPAKAAPAKVDLSGALDVLVTTICADLSGVPLSTAALVRLVPRLAAALHVFSAPLEEKKKVILAAAHKLVDRCVPVEQREVAHELVDAVVPAAVDAVMDVVSGDVAFPAAEAKPSWFRYCLLCSRVACAK